MALDVLCIARGPPDDEGRHHRRASRLTWEKVLRSFDMVARSEWENGPVVASAETPLPDVQGKVERDETAENGCS